MSFERTGIESTLLLANIGVVIWVFILNGAFIIVIYFPMWLINRTFGKLASPLQKIKGYFFWGGLLRLLMEAFMELLMASILNVYMADWEAPTWQESTSNNLSIAILAFIALLLPFLAIYLTYNLDAFKYEEFSDSYGAVLDGTRYETPRRKRIAIAYTAVMFLRRSVFVVSCIFWADFLWGQLALQILSSILMVCYVLQYRPLTTPFGNRMEVMNECTTLGLIYGLLGLT